MQSKATDIETYLKELPPERVVSFNQLRDTICKNLPKGFHMGLYGNKKLLDWFVGEYPKHSKTKLDMGKSCVRFKKPEHIPFELIGELMRKVSVEEYVSNYLQLLNGSKK